MMMMMIRRRIRNDEASRMTMVVMVLGNVLETVVMTFIIFLCEDNFGDGARENKSMFSFYIYYSSPLHK